MKWISRTDRSVLKCIRSDRIAQVPSAEQVALAGHALTANCAARILAPMKQYDDSMLGKEKIGKLLLKLSVPATIAMMVNAVYNLVDAIYIARGVGTDAIGGLALAFPVQMLIMAFGGLLGMGAASVISRSLGANNRERATTAVANTLGLSAALGVVVAVFGLIFIDPLIWLLGASEVLHGYAKDYLSVILIGSVFMTIAMVSSGLIRAEGQAKVSMRIMLIGAGLNIVLDPIFIFVFKLGIAGAAWATTISQFVSFLYIVSFYLRGGSVMRIKRANLVPQWSVLREIFALGVPAFIRQGGMSILMVVVNNTLGAYGGDIYISAYGVVNRLFMFMLMPLFGVVQGFQPITGYNYGARQPDRVKATVKLSMLSLSIYGAFATFLLLVLPGFFVSLFTPDPALIETAKRIIRTIVLMFPLIGVQIIGAGFFQAIGKPIPALILGMSRQYFLLIPMVLILPIFFGISGVIASFPISDFLATIITVAWLIREMKKLHLIGAPIELATE